MVRKLFVGLALAIGATSVSAGEITYFKGQTQFCMVYTKASESSPENFQGWHGLTYVETAYVVQIGEGQIHVFNGNGRSSDSPYMQPVAGSKFLSAIGQDGYQWSMGTEDNAGYYTISKGDHLTVFNCTSDIL